MFPVSKTVARLSNLFGIKSIISKKLVITCFSIVRFMPFLLKIKTLSLLKFLVQIVIINRSLLMITCLPVHIEGMPMAIIIANEKR